MIGSQRMGFCQGRPIKSSGSVARRTGTFRNEVLGLLGLACGALS